jgi:hypothetical protein
MRAHDHQVRVSLSSVLHDLPRGVSLQKGHVHRNLIPQGPCERTELFAQALR